MQNYKLKSFRYLLGLRVTYVADLMGGVSPYEILCIENPDRHSSENEREEYLKVLMWCASEVSICNVKEIYKIVLKD